MFFDNKVISYNNGLNISRYSFAALRECILLVFIPITLVIITRWDSVSSELYSAYGREFFCEQYIRNYAYENYPLEVIGTVDEIVEMAYSDGKGCNSDFLWYGVFSGFYLLLIFLYLFSSKGVEFRYDKKRRIIYTVFNWRILVYRLPPSVESIPFDASIVRENEPFLQIPMVNIKNGKEELQPLGIVLANRNEQNPMIVQATKMYFCEENQSSDDQWVKDIISQSDGLGKSFLYNILIRPLYISLYKEASLDDPKLLAKIDAYLEKNPPNPAKDDLYKDFDFYNQK